MHLMQQTWRKDRLPPQQRGGVGGGVLGGHDLNDERDHDLDETQQLGALYNGGSDGWDID